MPACNSAVVGIFIAHQYSRRKNRKSKTDNFAAMSWDAFDVENRERHTHNCK